MTGYGGGAVEQALAEIDAPPLIRDLFGHREGQAPSGPPRTGLRLIEGGKG